MKNRIMASVTVAAGTPTERDIPVKNVVLIDFPKGRSVNVCELIEDQGFCIYLVNTAPNCTPESYLWLSKESFTALLISVTTYADKAGIGTPEQLDEIYKGESFTMFSEGFGEAEMIHYD